MRNLDLAHDVRILCNCNEIRKEVKDWNRGGLKIWHVEGTERKKGKKEKVTYCSPPGCELGRNKHASCWGRMHGTWKWWGRPPTRRVDGGRRGTLTRLDRQRKPKIDRGSSGSQPRRWRRPTSLDILWWRPFSRRSIAALLVGGVSPPTRCLRTSSGGDWTRRNRPAARGESG